MGFTEEAVKEELESARDTDKFEIWPEHIKAWQLFLHVQHQWRLPPMGGKPLGLDYPSVQTVLELMFPGKQRAKIFQQLQLIEAGALKAWPDKR
jgi:hypothetical protein